MIWDCSENIPSQSAKDRKDITGWFTLEGTVKASLVQLISSGIWQVFYVSCLEGME